MRVSVRYVGLFRHERDREGRLVFPRCSPPTSECRARADRLVTVNRGKATVNRGRGTVTYRMCRHHADALVAESRVVVDIEKAEGYSRQARAELVDAEGTA